MVEEVKKVVKKRKGVNGKKKGNGFEGTVSKLLGKVADPLNFKRTQGSGAYVGGKNYEKQFANFSKEMIALFVGDVACINEADCDITFNYSVECKCYKQREHMDLLFDKSMLYVWLKESEVDAIKVGKPGILIVKWNNTPVYVVARFNLPTVKKLILLEGVQVCRFEDLENERDFWVTPK